MTEYRKFPVGPAVPEQQYWEIPVNADGVPKRSSRAWKTMIANAVARDPADRSPAERAAIAREMDPENTELGRLQAAYALGERAAWDDSLTNPFASKQFQDMWNAGRNAARKGAK